MSALAVATVGHMQTAAQRHAAVRPVKPLDAESRRWLDELHRPGAVRDEALERLHALLLRAARFEVGAAGPGSRTCAAASSRRSRRRPPTTRS
jgi:hypothetical protein